MRTFVPKKADTYRRWRLVDADGLVLGRLATRVAVSLMGKDKPVYAPHLDCGDFVVVVNASRLRLTGNKWESKTYYRHTGYPGGIKATRASEMKPDELVKKAVSRMLPKSKLGRAMLKKLKVYAGAEHPHAAQRPEPMEMK